MVLCPRFGCICTKICQNQQFRNVNFQKSKGSSYFLGKKIWENNHFEISDLQSKKKIKVFLVFWAGGRGFVDIVKRGESQKA